MSEKIYGKSIKAGEAFGAAHVVGSFDDIEEMHNVYDRYKGLTSLLSDSVSPTFLAEMAPGIFLLPLFQSVVSLATIKSLILPVA